MNTELIDKVTKYVEEHIVEFHEARIDKLKKLKLKDLLKKKNPYLFKAKDLSTPGDIVKNLASAFMSSAEEAIFGDWLEGLVIFVNSNVYNGQKSSAEGIDLEFDKDGIRYLVSIKSGPKWSNSSSIKTLKNNFKKAIRILHTGNNKLNVIAINGCCYGKDKTPEKDGYYKYCGQAFWEFISGEDSLFIDIIEPLGTKAHEKNEEYMKSYDQMITKFTCEFTSNYCDANSGLIYWDKIVQFNSGKDQIKGKAK